MRSDLSPKGRGEADYDAVATQNAQPRSSPLSRLADSETRRRRFSRHNGTIPSSRRSSLVPRCREFTTHRRVRVPCQSSILGLRPSFWWRRCRSLAMPLREVAAGMAEAATAEAAMVVGISAAMRISAVVDTTLAADR